MKELIREDATGIVNNIAKDLRILEGSTVLVSGSSGFIGQYLLATISYLNETVFKKPCHVIAVSSSGYKDNDIFLSENSKKHITFIQHDVVKPLDISGPVDFIIHAASITPPGYVQYPLETINVTVSGTLNLLELAKKKNCKSFLFFSSAEIYGNPGPDDVPTPETYPGNVSTTEPRAAYYESKRLAETICLAYHRLFNTPVKIVRPFNMYGPTVVPENRRVLSIFLIKIMHDDPVTIHGTGLQTHTYCYVTDAVSGFFKALISGKNGEVYNIGTSADEVSLLELVNTIAKAAKKNPAVNKIPHPPDRLSNESERRCPNLEKAKKGLDYNPRVSLETGVARMVSWYRDEFGY